MWKRWRKELDDLYLCADIDTSYWGFGFGFGSGVMSVCFGPFTAEAVLLDPYRGLVDDELADEDLFHDD